MKHFSPKVLEALEFASIAHKGQVRKFPAHIPYISHVAAVALILCRAGFDENVVVAGVLHDVLEDTSHTPEEISSRFGQEVLNMVLDVTEDKKLPWAERKSKYLEHLKNCSLESRAISAADLYANRLSNLQGLRQGINPWVNFSSDPKAYVQRIFEIDRRRLEVVKQAGDIPFIAELEEAAGEVENITHKLLENKV